MEKFPRPSNCFGLIPRKSRIRASQKKKLDKSKADANDSFVLKKKIHPVLTKRS